MLFEKTLSLFNALAKRKKRRKNQRYIGSKNVQTLTKQKQGITIFISKPTRGFSSEYPTKFNSTVHKIRHL